MHFTLQCMPFCMKLAQSPLAQSVFIVQIAPKSAPMPVPVLLLLPLLVAVLVDVLPVLDVAPPLPP
jgi:hypothetical protein